MTKRAWAGERTGRRERLPQRAIAEGIGSAFLLAAVVGSGIMADRLTQGQAGLTLLANSLATGAALTALILALAPISGAHLNPVVTLAEAWAGRLGRREAAAYLAAQATGALAGVAMAHGMFGHPAFAVSRQVRHGPAQLLSEGIATFGLLGVILCCARLRPGAAAAAAGCYITAAFWFTASTSFANPAATLARTLTDTVTGIRPGDAPGFIAAQTVGAAGAALLFGWLLPSGDAKEN